MEDARARVSAALLQAPLPPPRPRAAQMDAMIGTRFDVLDHGFVRLIDYMGDDTAIAQAARVSYGGGTRRTSDDRGLLRYLMRHRHTSPFEQCEIKLHIKMPIFIARQWIRHRTANVCESSARYSILPAEYYLPEAAVIGGKPPAGASKQGRGDTLAPEDAEAVRASLESISHTARGVYELLLNEDPAAPGDPVDAAHPMVARELARIGLTLNTYTEWIWKIDLHNLLHFLALRLDSHAQYEIRAYAEIIAAIVERWTPEAWGAFNEYRRHAVTLPATAAALLRDVLTPAQLEALAAGLRERGTAASEITDLLTTLRPRTA